MKANNSAVAIFDTHNEAEDTIKQLKSANFNMNDISIIGRGYQAEDHVVGYYTAGDRMKYWGANGAFWGGLWGLLFGSAFFLIPGVGPLFIAGPLIAAIAGALEGAVVVGGLGVLGAALFSIGVPNDSILRYETSLRAGKFMLVVRGTAEETTRARELLHASTASEVQLHLAQSELPQLV